MTVHIRKASIQNFKIVVNNGKGVKPGFRNLKLGTEIHESLSVNV
jgi:hypothetical protein